MKYRYKLEIELDDEKIISDGKYEIKSIYETIRGMFADEGIPEVKTDSHMLVFASNKTDDKEFSKFGLIETTLMDSKWFRPYIKKLLWFNSEYGKKYCENALLAYEKEGL